MSVASCAVEGDLDEAVARRLLHHSGNEAGTVYGRQGKQHLRRNIGGYAHSAQRSPWFVLVDLDHEAPCGGALVADWIPDRPPLMIFRVAIREAEAWLLADRPNLAKFLSVSRDIIPRTSEELSDPKVTLVNIARRSRVRALREGVPPRPGSGRAIGPLYVTELSRFVQEYWDVEAAARESKSLSRALAALVALR